MRITIEEKIEINWNLSLFKSQNCVKIKTLQSMKERTINFADMYFIESAFALFSVFTWNPFAPFCPDWDPGTEFGLLSFRYSKLSLNFKIASFFVSRPAK